jgi:hypothetical protein
MDQDSNLNFLRFQVKLDFTPDNETTKKGMGQGHTHQDHFFPLGFVNRKMIVKKKRILVSIAGDELCREYNMGHQDHCTPAPERYISPISLSFTMGPRPSGGGSGTAPSSGLLPITGPKPTLVSGPANPLQGDAGKKGSYSNM